MNEANQTIEGWYALHDFRKIDWKAWKAASSQQHGDAEKVLTDDYSHWNQMEQMNQGSSAVYHILGHKADVVFIHLRETLAQLNECKTLLDKSVLGSYLTSTHSYVSVVELSNYFTKPGLDYTQDPEIMTRLKPIMPKAKHMCFYPMDKRRTKADNWYMLSTDERKAFMRSHGLIGRTYAGKVKQIITGSVGFDNWEWGVTLFADDALQIKKLIYEMRFDEASARFAEFGDFYLGNLLTVDDFKKIIRIQQM
jgi:peroxiredoxin